MDLQPCLIRPGLYLSSVQTEVYRDILDEHGITHILQVGAELQPTHLSRYKYLQLPVRDVPEQDIVKWFSQAFEFIDIAVAAGGSVLVHCQAGVSRSATVVIGYCMWKDKMSLDAATQKVMQARSVIWPNPGFKCQLRQFEALSCDTSKWIGWNCQKYLAMQYGDESVVFMSHMLGSSAADSLIGTGCRADPTRVLHRADVATAGCSSSNAKGLHGVAVGGRSSVSPAGSTEGPHDESSTEGCTGGVNSSARRISRDSTSSSTSKVSQGSKSSIHHSRNQQLKHGLHTTTIISTTSARGVCTGGSSKSSTEEPFAADVPTGAVTTDAADTGALSLEGKSISWLDKEAALTMAG